MKQAIDKACNLIIKLQQLKKIRGYVLTGAGVSKASDIPTFRGEDGLWERYDFEEVATYDAWIRNPEKIWKLYQEGIDLILNAQPNAAHKAIFQLENLNLSQFVITQNVDSLHQKAGSKNVIEVHGNFTRIKCTACGRKQILSKSPEKIPPFCDCGSLFRPDVVLFNESLPEKEISKAFDIAAKSDLVFVIGTSAEVIPAATLPLISKRNGAVVIVFNPEKTTHVQIADVFIQGKCEETLPIFLQELTKE
ncbi:MAG TPA: NAD-dependent deacylase [candidate division Zixibacteria bacterium]|nr:NAD-dependent deacylase [candidate division Zixibacteria bacterium]